MSFGILLSKNHKKSIFYDFLIEKCKKLLESRDLEMAKAFLHKLRGTSATSGLYKLSELSLKWEKSVDKNTDYQKMIPELLNEIGIGEKIISQFLKK